MTYLIRCSSKNFNIKSDLINELIINYFRFNRSKIEYLRFSKLIINLLQCLNNSEKCKILKEVPQILEFDYVVTYIIKNFDICVSIELLKNFYLYLDKKFIFLILDRLIDKNDIYSLILIINDCKYLDEEFVLKIVEYIFNQDVKYKEKLINMCNNLPDKYCH